MYAVPCIPLKAGTSTFASVSGIYIRHSILRAITNEHICILHVSFIHVMPFDNIPTIEKKTGHLAF